MLEDYESDAPEPAKDPWAGYSQGGIGGGGYASMDELRRRMEAAFGTRGGL